MNAVVDTSIGPSYCLHNNIWNTNYPDWMPFDQVGENLAFRFSLELHPKPTQPTQPTQPTRPTRPTLQKTLPQQWSTLVQQEQYMQRAVVLAKEAVAMGAGPYGALIVNPRTMTVVAEGLNHASKNPIWHGEMAAIANFSSTLSEGITVYDVASYHELYTTAEPCAMCMGAIDWSGFGRVYYGTSIPFIEQHGRKQIHLRATTVAQAGYTNVTVVGGILTNETDALYVHGEGKHAHHHRVQMNAVSGGR